MKYTCSIDIDRSLEEVVGLFQDPDNLQHWQPGLLSYEHIRGTPGEPGSTARLMFKSGKREINMTETILPSEHPHEFRSIYETTGVSNLSRSLFEPINEHRTRLISEQEFKFSGFMKLMGFLMPGAFRKQSEKFLQHFKEFAEKGNSQRE
jgi:hypothetical protein